MSVMVRQLRWNDTKLVCWWVYTAQGDITLCGRYVMSSSDVTWIKPVSDGVFVTTCVNCASKSPR